NPTGVAGLLTFSGRGFCLSNANRAARIWTARFSRPRTISPASRIATFRATSSCPTSSDFARFRLYDLEEGEPHEFTIEDFYKNVRLFGFVAGYLTTSYKEQDPVNIKAAERMGGLHDKLKAIGYEGHELEVYLVRLLFCLFADATSIFERRQFQ